MQQNHMPRVPLLSLSVVSFALLGAGCFGSDPNKNSQIANPDAGTPMTGSGTIDPTKPIAGMPLASFDTDAQGFGLDPYPDTAAMNLADPARGASPSIRHEPDDGSPANGAIRIVAPYDGRPRQYVDLSSPNFGANLRNWSGGLLRVRVKVVEGTFTGGAQLYVKTGTMYSFGGTWIDFPAGSGWKELTLDVDDPMTFGNEATYDTSEVISYGVQLNTGDGGGTTAPVTFIVDSFSLELPAGGGTGGADGGAGGTTGSDGSAD